MNPIKKKKLGHVENSVSTMRALCIDMINKAKSGHPGMALDAAPIMYALFHDHLVADPSHPDWINRDRFVLSAGHASSLLYATLHLCGYGVSMDDLKAFRQLNQKTAGHPEVGLVPGVDCTSGPLGQGIAQAVGMAIAEKSVSSQYEDGEKLINHYTYCLCGDGCLQEGISQEAISLAGQLRLNKLILIYDENGCTLDGPTSDAFDENVKLRFLASNWNVLEVKKGNQPEAISEAIFKAKESLDYPTLIIVHTTIGYGSQFAGTSKVHGAPLGEEDGNYAKAQYGYTLPPFEVAKEVYDDFASFFASRGKEAYQAHKAEMKEYEHFHPEAYNVFKDSFARATEPYLPKMPEFDASEATRTSSGKILNNLANTLPFTLGGSADVASSVKTNIKGFEPFSANNPKGRDLRFGIREFAMASICNGLALHGGVYSYCGSFFVFADYMRPAIRMSALQNLPVLYLFSHDTIAVGEDGPTHQPVEHIASLRIIPNLDVIRPADGKETYGAYLCALKRHNGPTAILMSRQNLPQLEATDPYMVEKGAYIIHKPSKEANIQLITCGSETSLCIEASKKLEEKRIFAEVVSMPSWMRFLEQEKAYQDEVLHLPYEKRIAVEMASTFGWKEFAKTVLGVNSFGKSAKAKDVIAFYGFDLDSILVKIEEAAKNN